MDKCELKTPRVHCIFRLFIANTSVKVVKSQFQTIKSNYKITSVLSP